MADRAQMLPEPVPMRCACSKTWTQNLRHYDIVQCSCGRRVWTLRPLRNGPLQCFPYVAQDTVFVS